jgi:hypothetical protein
MDPVTAGISAIGSMFGTTGGVLSLASTGLGMLGGLVSSSADQATLRAQQSASRYNQQIALQNASIAEQQTAAEMEKQDRMRRLRLGSARAAAGAGGRGMTGSILDVMQDNIAQETLDLLTIKSEGLLRQQTFKNEATLLGMEASSLGGQIKSTKAAGYLGAASSMFGGASKLIK